MMRCYHNGRIVIKQKWMGTHSRPYGQHLKLYKACADCGCEILSAAGRFGSKKPVSLGTIGAKK